MDEIEKVKNIIASSGNNFHCKILNYLKGKGWSVLISPYYNDNFSDKPREIDLIAEKAFPVKRSNYCVGYIDIRLFVECKYIPQPAVFWFHDRDENKAEELVLNTTNMEENNTFTEHRYISPYKKVAKLFASEPQKNAENEPLYKALNQSLNAMVYYRNSSSIVLPPHVDQAPVLPTLNYPVIACSSFNHFYRIDIDDASQEPIAILIDSRTR